VSDGQPIVPRCHMPWQQMVIDTTGAVAPCCYWGAYENDNGPVGNIRHQSIDEIWNGEPFQKLRAAMAAGDLKAAGCERCFAVQQKLELGFDYDPDSDDDHVTPYADNIRTLKAEIANGATVLQARPTIVSYTPSHRCNIRCTHCYQESTRTSEIDRAEADREVEGLAPYLVKLIAGGGEPFLLPIWRRFLTGFDISINPYLDFATSTNATILTDQIRKGLSRFKKLTINISLDGTGAAYERVRVGATFDQVVENIRKIKTLIRQARSRKSYMGVSMCVMRSNILDLPNFIRFATREELSFGTSPVISMPPDESLRCFNDAPGELAAWRGALMEAELALEEYFPAFAKLGGKKEIGEALKETRRQHIRMIGDLIPFELADVPHRRVTIHLADDLLEEASQKHHGAPLMAYIFRFGEGYPAPFWGNVVDNRVEVSLPAGKYTISFSTKWETAYNSQQLVFEVDDQSVAFDLRPPPPPPLPSDLRSRLTYSRIKASAIRRFKKLPYPFNA
jgi:radical SAM protein with 4Fe4S-binding SPASM domain